MSQLDTRSRVTAQRLLAKFGAACTLTSKTPGAYNPATGEAVVTTTNQSAFAAVFDYPETMIDRTNVLTGDKQVFMGAVGITAPVAGDVFTWHSVDYAVIKVKPLAPAGVTIMLELQVRK